MIDLANFSLERFVIRMAVIILAITIHEFAHAFSADRLGDPTPRKQGRISLLPPDHLDPIGTIMMVVSSLTGWGIGWGKPVMVNPANFRHPRRDDAIVSFAGPFSNLLQAVAYAGALRLVLPAHVSESVGYLLLMGVFVNLGLAFFNLIPIAPLDGHWILGAMLPRAQGDRYMLWMRRYGPLVFLAVIFLGRDLIGLIIGPPVNAVARLLLPGIIG